MGSGLPRPWLYPATESSAYLLPPGADLAVQTGASIKAGDTLATLPPLPHLIAFGESLRLTRSAGRAAIQALDGTSTETGNILGTHRNVLRTRSLPAPVSGAIRGLPDLGAVAILPANDRRLLRTDRPGVVAAIDSDQITITSRALRCRPAYVLGVGTMIGRFRSASIGGNRAIAQPPDLTEREVIITAIPHIATVAEFTAALRSAQGPIVIGTVSEAVAWEMLANPSTSRVAAAHIVAVLIGPGDSESGMRAIEHLRGFDGAMFTLSPQSGEITIFPKREEDAQWAEESDDPAAHEAFYRDPARWHAACIVEGEARIGLLETGIRTLVIQTGMSGDGSAWVPVVNITKCTVS